MAKKTTKDERTFHAEERVWLGQRFAARAEMVRDFLMCYQPLCAGRLVKKRGMRELVDQFHDDIIKVHEEFGGSFPRAIGEVSDEQEQADARGESGGDAREEDAIGIVSGVGALDNRGADGSVGEGEAGDGEAPGGTGAPTDDDDPASEEGR